MTAYLIAIAIIAAIYVLLALSLNLQWGHTGIINFGHVAFFAIGAYTSGLLALSGIAIPVAMIAACILAALAAWPLGLLTLRLKEDYLAVIAIGFSEVLRNVLENEMWLTNGPSGLPGIPRIFGSLGSTTRDASLLALLIVVNILVFVLLARLLRAPFGRVLRSIRDNEIAATALGKDVVRFKSSSFMLGAAIAGLAGAFYAHYLTFISPEQFTPDVTFNVWIAVVIGGSGSNLGVVVGTLLLITFLEGSRFLNDFGFGLDASRLAALRFMLVGIALVLCMLYRPAGLLPPSRAKG